MNARVAPSVLGTSTVDYCVTVLFSSVSINDFVANLSLQMLFLQMEDPKRDISLYINSPAAVYHGMAIYDTMNFLECEIVTYCVGQAASMATLLWSFSTP